MKHSDQQIVEMICQWLQQGLEVYLFTVIRTWGSSPRPSGSLLAICSKGEFIGSVSGGCVDDDLLQRVAAGEFNQAPPHYIFYGENTESRARFGLPCGGSLQLLAESQLSLPQFSLLNEKLAQRQAVTRHVCLNTQETSLHLTRQQDILRCDEHNIWRSFGAGWQMLLIGAGDLSHKVCEMALLLDYQITVCDPRESYRNSWPLASVPVSARMPDDLLADWGIDDTSIVLALSHDPKLDDMALMTALACDAFYIGALGSKRNNAQRRERLTQLGLNAEQIARLHGPVGLDLGSRTPAEIALAILADITARRHGKQLVSS